MRSFAGAAIVAVIMFLASRHFLDPLSGMIRSVLRLPPAEERHASGRGLWALAAGFAAILIWLQSIFESFVTSHWDAVLLMLAVSVLIVGSVTLGWIAGAATRLPLSGLLGGLAGLVANGAVTYALMRSAGSTEPWYPLMLASAVGASAFAIAGLLGGLAIDSGFGRRPSISASLAAFIAMLACGLVGVYGLGSTTLAGVAPNLFLTAGWLLGFVSCPYSDAVLRRRNRGA